MAEKPILFSTGMVLAILDDRKTETRRVIKDVPRGTYRFDYDHEEDMWEAIWGGSWQGTFIDGYTLIKCPYNVGDKLWVRETWTHGAVVVGEVIKANTWYRLICGEFVEVEEEITDEWD